MATPYSMKKFQAAAGFVRPGKGCKEIFIPSERFQREFPDQASLVRDLRSQGYAVTETGTQPKLTIKTPKSICASGRVYCIRLPD
jgi:hypothetical protein